MGVRSEITITVSKTFLFCTGLSQAEFARSIGVKKATLVNWEQGRRRPDGPARVLLALIAKDPGIVQRVLGEG
jgi:putative transcriptional regulator